MGSWERVMAEYQISKYTEYNMRQDSHCWRMGLQTWEGRRLE